MTAAQVAAALLVGSPALLIAVTVGWCRVRARRVRRDAARSSVQAFALAGGRG